VGFGKGFEWGTVARAVELRCPHQAHQPHLEQIIEGLGSAGRIEGGYGFHERLILLNAAIAAGNSCLTRFFGLFFGLVSGMVSDLAFGLAF
jgi:hypothetical protein